MIKITYYFGSDDFDFEPSYKQYQEFLVPVLVRDLKKTKAEVEEMLENDEFFEEQIESYYDELKDYFQEDAEYEYEATQDSFDGFDSYEGFCAWRSPSLLRR